MAPKYNVDNRKKRKLTPEIMEAIQGHLDDNERKRLNGQGKIQKKGIDIHEALLESGFDISYSTVCNTVRNLLNNAREAFIKAHYELGDVCEFDWGEVKLTVGGRLIKLQLSVFTSAAGNYRYALLFHKQDTACFLESHADFFEHLGGAYKRMVYDNTRVAVKRLAGAKGEPTEALSQLSLYYGFDYRFCNVNSGNEKAHVERSVEVVRRKAFSNKDTFDSLEEANQHLLNKCLQINNRPQKSLDEQTALEILEKERPFLLPNRPKFDAARIAELRVNKYSVITVDNCYYSVPDKFVGKLVLTKIYSNEIRCFYNEVLIATHERLMGNNLWTIKLEHYLDTLKRKPGALYSSVALNQADPRVKMIYNNYFVTKEKDFIDLMFFISECGIEKVEEAITSIKKATPLEINTEMIKAICNRKTQKETQRPIDDYTSQIKKQSLDMLKQFAGLIPSSEDEFLKETNII